MVEALLTAAQEKLVLLDLIAQRTDTALNLTTRFNRLSQGAVRHEWVDLLAVLQGMARSGLVTANTVDDRCMYLLTGAGDTELQANARQLQELHMQLAQLARERDATIERSLEREIASRLSVFGTETEVVKCCQQIRAELLPFALTRAGSGTSDATIVQQTLTAAGDLMQLAGLLLGRGPVHSTDKAHAEIRANTPALTDASGELTLANTHSEFAHDLVGIRTIVIEAQKTDVHIFPSNSHELRVREHFAHFLDAYAGQIIQKADALHVLPGKRPATGSQDADWGQALLTIGIPVQFKGDIQVHAAYGNVGALNLRHVHNLAIENELGNTELVYLAVRGLSVVNTRGDVTLRGSNIQVADLSLQSGSPLVEQSVFAQLAVQCASGAIKLCKLNVENSIQILGGDCTVDLQELRAGRIQVGATKGTVATKRLHAAAVNISLKQGNISFTHAHEEGAYFKMNAVQMQVPREFVAEQHSDPQQQNGVWGKDPQAHIELSAPAGQIKLEVQ